MVSIGILAPMEGTYSIEIQAPRQAVFEFLSDLDNLKKIVPNLIEAGIIDPTKVTRSALQNAASVSGLLLTTEAMIAEAVEVKDEHSH